VGFIQVVAGRQTMNDHRHNNDFKDEIRHCNKIYTYNYDNKDEYLGEWPQHFENMKNKPQNCFNNLKRLSEFQEISDKKI
jgi:hypothetical protein